MSMMQCFPRNKSPSFEFVVACSGGLDSMVLLDLLRNTVSSPQEQISVVYVDHGQRDSVSKDKKIIQAYCLKYQLKNTVFKLEIEKNVSELELRKKRYLTLFEFVKKSKNAVLLTAHHQDDQLETLFFRILRGAYDSSLAGILSRSTREGVVIVRPLLDFSKKELYEYAKKTKLKWSEDETNLNTQFSRNLIRHKIFPLLEKAHPGALKNLNEFLTQISLKNFQKNRKLLLTVQKYNADFAGKKGLEVKTVTFDILKKLIDQALADSASRTTKSHWLSLKKQIEQRRATKSGGGPEKIIQFPGGNFVLFRGNRLFWNKA